MLLGHQMEGSQQDEPDVEAGTPDAPLLELRETLKAFFGFPWANTALVISTIKYVNLRSVSGMVSFISLALSLIFHIAGWLAPEARWRPNDIAYWCKIAYLCTFLRTVAPASLLLHIGTVHTVVVLPLLLLVLLLLAFFFKEKFSGGTDISGSIWGDHKGELKRHFELCSKVVSMAFGGLSGTVNSFMKRPSNMTGGGYMAPECFLFYGLVLGLLVVLLCTVPADIPNKVTRAQMARLYIPILSYVALLFLVLAGVMAAEEILREYVFIMCFDIVVIAVGCFLYDNHYGVSVTPGSAEEDEDSKHSQVFVACFTLLFGVLMAAHLKYGNQSSITVSSSLWFKAFVVSIGCGILNYAAHIVVLAELHGTKEKVFAKKAWRLVTYLCMASFLICLSVVGYQHPDVLKDAF